MNFFSDDFIQENNTRILSQYEIQPRYIPEQRTNNNPKEDIHIKSESENIVNDTIKTCLWEINKYQFKKTLTEIQKTTGLPAGTFFRVYKKCERMKLVKVAQVPFGKGRPKYPVLLPDGYKALGVEQKTFNGRGAGYEHTLYQHLILKHFSDFKPVIEFNRGNKNIDVAIETSELLLAIEVAMTSIHEKENIEKDINMSKANYVIVACINEKVQKEVQEIITQLPDDVNNKTEACLISELLKKKPEETIKHQLKLLI